MNISINGQQLKNIPFENEKELQEVLNENGYLILNDDEPKVEFVQHEIILGAGRIDTLLVDETGVPVITEVKLDRNRESRREVLAQVFDYTSAITDLTIDELDELTAGALDQALSTLKEDGSLWRTCAANLRAGVVKVVVLIDKANDDLIRIFKFLNEHTDLDVRLVEIHKFDNNGTPLYVPNIIGTEVKTNSVNRGSSLNRGSKEILDSITNAFNNASQELQINSKSKYIRQLKPWKTRGQLHYEFLPTTTTIGAELHLETDYEGLPDLLKPLDGTKINDFEIKWDGTFFNKKTKNNNRGRLIIMHDIDTDSEIVATSMIELIRLTKPIVDNYINTI